ncbi:MAG: protein kinase [Chloroflexota bacterium]
MTEKLGNYEVRERLGRGGMAEVYRAYHHNLDRFVAIKLLHAFLAEDDEFRVRFEKEARNIAKLKHPHIVQVYDFDYAPQRDSYYMVMELIEGETLKDRLFDLSEQGKKPDIDETLRMVSEAASALSYAHARGMIHRDVKPANLMIDLEDRVVLTDFGIAKMLDSKQLTVSGGMIGTPAYMSPEQGLGEAGDERSDLYSLGVIMYQLLVGDLPYDAETALGVILMHVNDPIPDARAFNPDVPPAVQDIVNRAMAKDPDTRYQSADEIVADIEKYQQRSVTRPTALFPPGTPRPVVAPTPSFEPVEPAGNGGGVSEPLQAALPSPEPEPERTASRSSSVWLAVVGIVGLLFAAGGGYVYAARDGLITDFTGVIAPAVAVGELSSTPTVTQTPSVTPTQTPNLIETQAAFAQQALSETPGTATPTDLPTETEMASPTASAVPASPTPVSEPTETHTPSPSPNASLTAAVLQTATIEACDFDYAIVEQIPPDGQEGDFFRVNEPYTREITFLNTGTCEWGENASLTFVQGEDFEVGTRVFIRDSVQIGEEFTLMFEGTAPSQGSVDPIVGTWQLRTRGQLPIGEAFDISVMVFDPGS